MRAAYPPPYRDDMKNNILKATIIIFLFIIIMELDTLKYKIDFLAECVAGSSQAVITEFYRYVGD